MNFRFTFLFDGIARHQRCCFRCARSGISPGGIHFFVVRDVVVALRVFSPLSSALTILGLMVRWRRPPLGVPPRNRPEADVL